MLLKVTVLTLLYKLYLSFIHFYVHINESNGKHILIFALLYTVFNNWTLNVCIVKKKVFKQVIRCTVMTYTLLL